MGRDAGHTGAVSDTALIVVDMLNRYEHADAAPLAACVRERLPAMRSLLDAARDRDVLTVYVNDNYGDWSANGPSLAERALAGRPELIEPILPGPDAPFVIKARHSIFYQTQMEYLLRQEGIGRIVLLGQVTEQCILYSALDAYVRHFHVVVAPDAVAHIHEDLAQAALRMMELNMRARLTDAGPGAFD
jgi:nicotinamidase-related amidase